MSEIEILPGVSVDIDDDVVDLGEHGTVKLFETNWQESRDPRVKPMPRPEWTGTKEDYAKGYGAGWAGLATMPYNALMSFATQGIPGDLRERTRNALMAPTEEQMGEKMGADTESTAFTAGTLGLPGVDDALLKGGAIAAKGIGAFLPFLGQTMFHGTPHKFSRFSMDAIGTGEGAQAFGHGLYFAENPGVAKSYRQSLAPGRGSAGPDIANRVVADAMEGGKSRKEAELLAIKEFESRKASAQTRATDDNFASTKEFQDRMDSAIEAVRNQSYQGHLYEVDIPDEAVAKMLDWDAPLGEQTIIGALESDPRIAQQLVARDANTGAEAYEVLTDMLGSQEAASDYLRQAGIPGIRFFDQQSRGYKGQQINVRGIGKSARGYKVRASLGNQKLESPYFDTEAEAKKWIRDKHEELVGGTRNIVVFNPDDITQVTRDGDVVFKKEATNALADQEFAVTALKHDDTAAAKAAVMAGRETPTRRELEQMDIEELDRLAFGYAEGDTATLRPNEISIQWEGDLDNPIAKFEKEGDSWLESVDFSEPVEVTVKQDGKIYLEDGHHRWFAANKLGIPIDVKFVTIKGKPIEAILGTDLHKKLSAEASEKLTTSNALLKK